MDRIYNLFASASSFIGQVEAPPATGGGTPGGSAPPPPGCGNEQLLIMVGIFVLFYFLLIRPQQKQQKQHQALIAGLKRGDRVITQSGILGRITQIEGPLVTLEIAKGTEIQLLKSFVRDVASDKAIAQGNQTPQPPQG